MSLLHICHRLVLILFLLIKQSRNNYIFILSATSLSSSHAWLILLINRQNLWPCVKLSRSLPRGIPWGNLRPSNWWISPRRHFTPSAVYMGFVNRTQFWKGVQVFFYFVECEASKKTSTRAKTLLFFLSKLILTCKDEKIFTEFRDFANGV